MSPRMSKRSMARKGDTERLKSLRKREISLPTQSPVKKKQKTTPTKPKTPSVTVPVEGVEWEYLPNEMWWHVFSFLPNNFPRTELSMVSTHMRHLVDNFPMCQSEMFFRHYKKVTKYDFEEFTKILSETNSMFHYVELMLKWVVDTKARKAHILQLWNNIDQSRVCFDLLRGARNHMSHHGLHFPDAPDYLPIKIGRDNPTINQRFQSYCLNLNTKKIQGLLETGQCKIGRERSYSKPQRLQTCRISPNCNYPTQTCYKIVVENDRYVIRDLTKKECRKTAKEHCHVNSVKHAWIRRARNKFGWSWRYISLLTTPKAEVDGYLKDIGEEGNYDWVGLYVIFDSQHIDY